MTRDTCVAHVAALWPAGLGDDFKAPLLAYHDECWRVCEALMRGAICPDLPRPAPTCRDLPRSASS